MLIYTYKKLQIHLAYYIVSHIDLRNYYAFIFSLFFLIILRRYQNDSGKFSNYHHMFIDIKQNTRVMMIVKNYSFRYPLACINKVFIFLFFFSFSFFFLLCLLYFGERNNWLVHRSSKKRQKRLIMRYLCYLHFLVGKLFPLNTGRR